jgi:hypothetical protein
LRKHYVTSGKTQTASGNVTIKMLPWPLLLKPVEWHALYKWLEDTRQGICGDADTVIVSIHRQHFGCGRGR